MQKDILTSFFQKNISRFSPRAEAFLKSAHAYQLQSLNFRYVFGVSGMIEISHLIEDAIISTPGVAETHVSFQYFSRINAQHERYTRVARASNGLWLYGVPDAPLPDFERTTGVDTTDTVLENYWFVIGYGPGVSMTLLAEEFIHEAPETAGERRMYEGFYTFDPNLSYKLLMVLHHLFPAQVAEPTMPELF
jgi:hypothetical protein